MISGWRVLDLSSISRIRAGKVARNKSLGRARILAEAKPRVTKVVRDERCCERQDSTNPHKYG